MSAFLRYAWSLLECNSCSCFVDNLSLTIIYVLFQSELHEPYEDIRWCMITGRFFIRCDCEEPKPIKQIVLILLILLVRDAEQCSALLNYFLEVHAQIVEASPPTRSFFHRTSEGLSGVIYLFILSPIMSKWRSFSMSPDSHRKVSVDFTQLIT